MEVKKIYFDMDGVLADFERGVKELCHMDPPNQNDKEKDPNADDEMWAKIKEVGDFYYKLEFMPHAKEMFDLVYSKYGDKCEILTGIPKEKRKIVTAGEDKIRWVRDYLSKDIKVNIVYREDKPKYCTGSDCILIDDMEKNIQEWEADGGTGVRNSGACSTIVQLIRLGILDKKDNPRRSGFDAPVIGVVLSEDTVIKRNSDGTIELNP